jgi:hypothetical protein
MIGVTCPKCHYHAKFPDDTADRPLRCPNCEEALNSPGRPEPHPAREPEEDSEASAAALPAVETAGWTERVLPAALLGAGLVLAVIGESLSDGTKEVAALLLIVAVQFAVTVPLTLLGMFVSAKLLDVSFGPLGTTILKLAAISAVVLGIVTMADVTEWSWAGYVLAVPITWYLFSLFFDLNFFETLMSLIVIGLVQGAVGSMIATALRRGS